MEYHIADKYYFIKRDCLSATSKNPVEIAKSIMKKDYVNIHGPEHHYLDGAAFLAAYKNAGGIVDLENRLDVLAERAKMMPGAMCGYWGVCGSVTAIGAALSVIHQTAPLSNDVYYKDNMEFTSKVLAIMAKIGGPRCCKRNAFTSISNAVNFVKEKYGVKMELSPTKCEFSYRNEQCIKSKCPYYSKQCN